MKHERLTFDKIDKPTRHRYGNVLLSPNTKIFINQKKVLEGVSQFEHDVRHFLSRLVLMRASEMFPKETADFIAQSGVNMDNCGDFSFLGEVIPTALDKLFRGLELIENQNATTVKITSKAFLKPGSLEDRVNEAMDIQNDIRLTFKSEELVPFLRPHLDEILVHQGFQQYAKVRKISLDALKVENYFNWSSNELYEFSNSQFNADLRVYSISGKLSPVLQGVFEFMEKQNHPIPEIIKRNQMALDLLRKIILQDPENLWTVDLEGNFYAQLNNSSKASFLDNIITIHKNSMEISSKRDKLETEYLSTVPNSNKDSDKLPQEYYNDATKTDQLKRNELARLETRIAELKMLRERILNKLPGSKNPVIKDIDVKIKWNEGELWRIVESMGYRYGVSLIDEFDPNSNS
ncbi:MAG: hypothetical protein OHK0017_05630 [Patescibacteria group bacterium]